MPQADGKWQLAFWIITGFFVTSIVFLGNGVIANDRRNTEEHTEIRSEIDAKTEEIEDTIEDKIDDIRLEQMSIGKTQTKILTILERIDDQP